METSANWLNLTTKKLQDAGIGTARLDALILLEDVIGKERSWLLAHPEFEFTDAQIKKLGKLVARRAKHEPLSYIRGKTEFYGRQFFVNKHVLEPRPESETMIELLKSQLLGKSPKDDLHTIIDIGTGSGALAVTAKLEMPNAEVIGIDVDEKCLKVARKNAKALTANVNFLQGDLLAPLHDLETKTFALLCNLPYVPDNFSINPAAMMEPRIAIFGGQDGLDVYRKLFSQISQASTKPDYVLTESLPLQHDLLTDIASRSGYGLTKRDDFIQLFTKLKN